MGDNRAYSYGDRSDALEASLPTRYRSPGRSDLPHLQLELMRRSFARIDTCREAGENNKVRRRELLSFFTG
jgi:hypothetical protein